MLELKDEFFMQDLIKKALCEVCPVGLAYTATKIAICKKENVIIVQQLCPRCYFSIQAVMEKDEMSNIVFKQKL